MNRIHDGEAPMFSPVTSWQNGRGSSTVEFEDTHAPRGERDTGVTVAAGWSTVTEDVKIIQIDTTEGAGPIRIYLNDALVYEGNPESTV